MILIVKKNSNYFLFCKLQISREASIEINMENFEKFLLCLNGYEFLRWLNEIYPIRVNKLDL
jgi:hypothetical protein